MTSENDNFSLRTIAIIAGLSLIIMALSAGFSVGYVQSSLILKDDGFQTFTNLSAHKGLFTGGIIGWIIILLTDIIVSWALYLFFKATNSKISLATAILRLVYCFILVFSILQLFGMLSIVSGDSMANNELGQTILSKFAASEKIWSAGLIIFGFHLLGLGFLSLKNQRIHKVFGILLLIAGAGYILVHTGKQISGISQELVGNVEMILSLPMAAGELLFAFWLLIRGGKS